MVDIKSWGEKSTAPSTSCKGGPQSLLSGYKHQKGNERHQGRGPEYHEPQVALVLFASPTTPRKVDAAENHEHSPSDQEPSK
jgi:hypothetical protein